MADEDKDQPRSLYERDFYAWARREAVLLQRREFAQLDLANVIENQIEDNPSLRELGEAAVARCWHRARRRVCTELDFATHSGKSRRRGRHGLWREVLPKRCPFSYAQIAGEEPTAFSEPDNLLPLPVETP